jgi:hypothetical protein
VSLTQALNVGTVFGWILVFRKMTKKRCKRFFHALLDEDLNTIILPLTKMLFYMGYLFLSPNFVISQTGDHPQED